MHIRIIWFLLLTAQYAAHSNASTYDIANGVLEQLYEAGGNKKKPLPTLLISQDEKNAAEYRKRKNTIVLSEKAYQACRTFQEDSLAALAFVLGHELSHALQTTLSVEATSFFAREYHPGSDVAHEEAADVQGLFLAYLAGYKNTRDILPELIVRIYREFHLEGIPLFGYPTLEERQNTAKKTIAKTNELIQLYEAGLYLMAMKKYDLAAACFEYISNGYAGREIHNNLGVCYALWAMNFTAENTIPYIFPFEVNWETRMRRVKGTDIGPEEKALMESYLAKAEEYLDAAIQLDPGPAAPKINRICVWILRGHYEKALEQALMLYSDMAGRQDVVSQKRWHLALALAHAYMENREMAMELWNELETQDGPESANARINAQVFQGKNPQPGEGLPCPDLPDSKRMIDGVRLHRLEQANKIVLPVSGADRAVQVSLFPHPNSVVCLFDDGHTYTALQRVFAPLPGSDTTFESPGLLTDRGSMHHCFHQDLVLSLDQDGRVLEWGKYVSGMR